MSKEFRLSIDITITGHTDGQRVAPLVCDALQELVNRRDFRVGSIAQGRAVEHLIDHAATRVTVDVSRLTSADLAGPV